MANAGENPPGPQAQEAREATYTFTLTVTRKGPGLASKENWLEFRRAIQTRRLTWVLAGSAAVLLVLFLAALIRGFRPSNAPERAATPGTAPASPLLGEEPPVITPLNAPDPASLVIPPSAPPGRPGASRDRDR